MRKITRQLVENCKSSPWDFSNKVLYDLCRKHPIHVDKSVIAAKILLIGRVYAAAIERRRTKEDGNDDFYLKRVAPVMANSKIDTWIANATDKDAQFGMPSNTVLSAHHDLTKLFFEITGLEKRSLASKYLHFHRPSLFYIFDARAVLGMRELSDIVGRAERTNTTFDREYQKFTKKCITLRNHIRRDFKISLNPREIDNLLLEIHSGKT